MIRELIESGELGEIYFISTSRVNLGLHQPDVSVVWDLGPHDFSILRYWLGESPHSVSAMSRGCIMPGTPDVASSTSSTPRGRSRTSSSPGSRRASCAGRRSSARARWSSTTTRATSRCASSTRASCPRTRRRFGEYQLTYRTGDIVSPPIAAAEPLGLELDDFCSAIRNGEHPRSSAALGLDVVRMIEAVDRSLERDGAKVRLPGRVPAGDVPRTLNTVGLPGRWF